MNSFLAKSEAIKRLQQSQEKLMLLVKLKLNIFSESVCVLKSAGQCPNRFKCGATTLN
jgi:hypothetical protein